jgi:uracil-DNA glycosylase family 4
LLGATAATAVLNYKGPLNEVRGKWKKIKIMNSYFDVLTTFHPASILRFPNKKILFLKDLSIIKKKL